MAWTSVGLLVLAIIIIGYGNMLGAKQRSPSSVRKGSHAFTMTRPNG